MSLSRPTNLLRWTLAPAIVWALYLVRANIWFRLYPVVMSALALAWFAVSLFRTPLVETFARTAGAKLDRRGIAYCRTVTCVWTGFLAVHLAVTGYTVFASHKVWAVYNGFLAYVLMGTLFAGEWIVRRRIQRHA